MAYQAKNHIRIGDRVFNFQIDGEERVGRNINYICRCDCGCTLTLPAILLWNQLRKDCGCGCSGTFTQKSSKKQSKLDPESHAQSQKKVVLNAAIQTLIVDGLLPLPDGYLPDTVTPVWDINSICKIFEVRLSDLVRFLVLRKNSGN